MADFRSMIPPERRAELDRTKFNELRKKQALEALSNSELAEEMENYMNNSTALRMAAARNRTSPTYDSSLWYILMPIAIERLRDSED